MQGTSTERPRLIFILGRNPELSTAELHAVFGGDMRGIAANACVLDPPRIPEETVVVLFRRLGGSVKFGVVDGEILPKAVEHELKEMVATFLATTRGAKTHLGVSVYGEEKEQRVFAHAALSVLLKAKTAARESGQSVRVVTSREPTLSAVVVSKNRLIGDFGREFLVMNTPSATSSTSTLHFSPIGEKCKVSPSVVIGHTLAVHDFEGQSARDYGRPRRDPRRGMLPVQLARIMVNFALPTVEAKLRQTVLDPFCGIGTVLQEALLLGHTVIGSDIDPKAIEDTRVNLEWLLSSSLRGAPSAASRSVAGRSNPSLLLSDIRLLPPKLRGQSITAIVTELDLGPPVRGALTPARVEDIRRSLLPLYRDAFAAFAEILKPGSRVVAALPAWRIVEKNSPRAQSRDYHQNVVYAFDSLSTIIDPHFQLLITDYQLSDRHTFLYGRPDQRVWREIVVAQRR